MADKQTCLIWANTVAGVDGMPANTLYYYLRPVGGSRDADDAAFYALSSEQKIALSKLVFPTSVNGWKAQDESGNGSPKLIRLYVGRNQESNSLSFYADGTGTLKINLRAMPGTPIYLNGLKTMTTADGPYPRAGLFPGTMPYGSYFPAVPNGNYLVDWQDEDGQFLSFNITLTAKLPFYQLAPFGTTTTPTNPNPPTNPPVNEQVYTSKGTLGGYVKNNA
jgi:hypothetical protein